MNSLVVEEDQLTAFISLENKSEYGLSRLEFEFEFYDDKGHFLDQLFARTMDHVDPGEKEDIVLRVGADQVASFDQVSDVKVHFVEASILSRK